MLIHITHVIQYYTVSCVILNIKHITYVILNIDITPVILKHTIHVILYILYSFRNITYKTY